MMKEYWAEKLGRLKNILRRFAMRIPYWQGALWLRSSVPSKGQIGVDLGSGPRKRAGFVGVDNHFVPHVDVVCDLEHSSLPFRAESIDIVNASHVLEHVRDLDHVLVQVSQSLKVGGLLQVTVPYAGDLRAFQDPTHVRFFTLKTFEYFVQEDSRVGGWYTGKYFRRIRRRHLVFSHGPVSLLLALVVNRNLALLDLYESTALRSFPARDLQVELEK